MPQTESSKQNLTADNWAEAALDALATGGLDAVAVEPLARRLGVTKGSFYWHFANRGALVKRALALWERKETDDVLARVGAESDPYERIVKLFKAANSSYRAGRLYLALAAATDDRKVQATVRRVTERRLSYLYECYRKLGMGDREARHWSRFAYATFMGNLQIRRDTPEAMPQGQEFNDYLRLMIKTLIPRVRSEEPSQTHESVVALRPTGSS